MTGLVKTWRARAGGRIVQIAARMRAHGRTGSAAIEFAFIAPIFLVLLMATLEVGLIFFGNMVLQNATNDAAREIRTGQVALSGMSAQDFKDKLVCPKIAPLLPCDTNLQIDVREFPTFGAVALPSPIRPDGTMDTTVNNWTPGGVCSIVLVRVFYTWSVATPLLTPFLVNVGGDKHLLAAASAFRNEPFTTAVSGC